MDPTIIQALELAAAYRRRERDDLSLSQSQRNFAATDAARFAAKRAELVADCRKAA